MAKDKLWTRSFIGIMTISFFIFLTFYSLLTTLPLYLVGRLHGGALEVGLVLSLFLLPAILVRPLAARSLLKWPQKQLLVFSTISFFIATLLYPFAKNLWLILLLRIVHGITFGVITTVKGTICAELIPASRRGEGLSYFSLAMTLAIVFGPFLGLSLGNIGAYNAVFEICMAISAINIVIALLIKIPAQNVRHVEVHRPQAFSFTDVIDKRAVPYALATFLLAFAYSGISAFLALFAKDLNLVKAAGYFFITYAIFVLLFRPFTGRWSDKYGSNFIIYPAILIFALGMGLLHETRAAELMVIAGAVIGIGYGSVTPIFQAQTINSLESHRVGLANAMFFSSMDAGMATGAYLLGMVANIFGYRSVYLVGAGMILATGTIYFALTRLHTQILPSSPNIKPT